MSLYLYDKVRKSLYQANSLVVIPNVAIENLKNMHKQDLDKGYSYIHIDEKTYKASVLDYEVFATVNEENDLILTQDVSDTTNLVKITKKKWAELENAKRKGKLVKYFKENIHIFDYDPIKVYNKETNEMDIDIDLYKAHIINKIKNSENEVRHHGFPYSFWTNDKTIYLQPFRVVGDNDLQVFTSFREETPANKRYIKLFVGQAGTRLTEIGTYKWLKGEQVTDKFLSCQIKHIIAYSGMVKEAIYMLCKHVETIYDINKLKELDKYYVSIVIQQMKKALDETIPDLKAMVADVVIDFKAKNITPSNDVLSM